jgi:2-C-methyl-D-erythritol 4-phosphate cytidylyltransferase
VQRGLKVIDPETVGIIIVHDAVRPFVRPDEIRAVIERAESAGAALMALSATDTIKQVKSGRVQRTLDRRRIHHAQTPQAFRYALLAEAFERADAAGFVATDEAQLVEHCGHRVSVVEGSPINIKITRPLDLKIAEVIQAEFFS